MTLDVMRETHNAKPFRAYTIRLSDGRSVPVHHPEFVAFGPRSVAVWSPDSRGFKIIDARQIVSLDMIETNGEQQG